MTKRIWISALVSVLIIGTLFFAGCQTPEEIAAVEAARASARAALASARPQPAPEPGVASSVVTLKSVTGTVQRAEPPRPAQADSASLSTEETVPAQTDAPAPPDLSSDPAGTAAEPAAAEPQTAASRDPYARVPVGTDYEILRLGSEGALVERLNLYLSELGYLPADAGSNFGPETEAAVIALQERNSLEPDGIVGNSTWDLLLMSNARPA